MIDIQAMRKLLKKASKGEWRERTDLPGSFPCCVLADGYENVCPAFRVDNAAFIAAAHNNMAELLDLAEIGLKARDGNDCV